MRRTSSSASRAFSFVSPAPAAAAIVSSTVFMSLQHASSRSSGSTLRCASSTSPIKPISE
jgi:hypothetical protein